MDFCGNVSLLLKKLTMRHNLNTKVTVSWSKANSEPCQISITELKNVFCNIGTGKNFNPIWQGSKYASEVESISIKTKIILREHFQ